MTSFPVPSVCAVTLLPLFSIFLILFSFTRDQLWPVRHCLAKTLPSHSKWDSLLGWCLPWTSRSPHPLIHITLWRSSFFLLLYSLRRRASWRGKRAGGEYKNIKSAPSLKKGCDVMKKVTRVLSLSYQLPAISQFIFGIFSLYQNVHGFFLHIILVLFYFFSFCRHHYRWI